MNEWSQKRGPRGLDFDHVPSRLNEIKRCILSSASSKWEFCYDTQFLNQKKKSTEANKMLSLLAV